MRGLEGGFGADVATRACSLVRLARQDPEYGYSRRLAKPVVAREKTQIMTKNGLTPSDWTIMWKGRPMSKLWNKLLPRMRRLRQMQSRPPVRPTEVLCVVPDEGSLV